MAKRSEQKRKLDAGIRQHKDEIIEFTKKTSIVK